MDLCTCSLQVSSEAALEQSSQELSILTKDPHLSFPAQHSLAVTVSLVLRCQLVQVSHLHSSTLEGRTLSSPCMVMALPTKAKSSKRTTWLPSGSCHVSSFARTTSTEWELLLSDHRCVANPEGETCLAVISD